MQTIVSKVSQHGYQKIVKPILFMQPPDVVHDRLLRYGSIVQQATAIRYITQASLAYSNESLLSQNLHGISYMNPVGLAAGFDKNFELVPLMKSVGFGFMEGGSVTFKACAGNPRPWFHRLPQSKSLVVNAGLANKGVETITKRILQYSQKTLTDFPLNISVAKTNSQEASTEENAIHDYIGSLILIKKLHIGDVITLNISCPNTYGGEPFTTPYRLERLLAAVDSLALTQPVFVKMPSQLPWPEFEKLLKVADVHKVAGVTISNLVKDRRSADIQDDLPDNIKGNLSGRPAFDVSNVLIQKTFRAYGERFTIIGVGGIFSAEDAYTKIKLGASLVELITGMIFEGPQLVGQINQGLVRLLRQDGYTHISKAVGTRAGPQTT